MDKRFDCTRRAMGLALLGICLASGLNAAPSKNHETAVPAKQTVLVLGDSLSAEYGLARGAGWVALLQARLAQQTWPVQVVNASISGETTSGGTTRLPALLAQHKPQVVVIELGANDALRGLPLRSTQSNLEAMVKASQATGAKVLLVGMMLPPNYGKRYTEDFARTFGQVAQSQRTAFLPFLLKGVADRPDARDWFQADGIHPLAKAHPVILDGVWPVLKPLFFGRQAGA